MRDQLTHGRSRLSQAFRARVEMEDDERAYSDKDFRRILKKAEELGKDSDSTPASGTSLSLSDMKAAAAEAGLDPALVERAARFVRADSGGSLAGRVLRVMGWKQLETAFPAPLTQERAAQILSVLRASAGQKGTREATPAGFVWKTDRGRVSVTMHNDGTGSRVKVSANPSRWLALSGWLGTLAGLVTIATLEPSTALAFIGSIGVGLGVALGTWASITSRARKRMDALMEAVTRAMQSVSELSAGPGESTGSGGHAEAGTE